MARHSPQRNRDSTEPNGKGRTQYISEQQVGDLVIEKHRKRFSWGVETGVRLCVRVFAGLLFEIQQPIHCFDTTSPCENPKDCDNERFIFAENEDNHQPAAPEQISLGSHVAFVHLQLKYPRTAELDKLFHFSTTNISIGFPFKAILV